MSFQFLIGKVQLKERTNTMPEKAYMFQFLIGKVQHYDEDVVYFPEYVCAVSIPYR